MLKHAVMAGLVSVALLALLEILSRFMGYGRQPPFPLDDTLGWRMKPASWSFTPAPERAELVLLGDSITYLDAQRANSFTQLLVKAGREVVNISGVGYGTDQELLFLQENAARLPRVKTVVLNFCVTNDFIDNGHGFYSQNSNIAKPNFEIQNGKLQRQPFKITRRERFYRASHQLGLTYLLQDGLERAGILQPSKTLLGGMADNNVDAPLSLEVWQAYHQSMLRGFPVTAALIRDLNDYVQRLWHGRLLVVIHPGFYVPPGTKPFTLTPELKRFFQDLHLDAYDMGCLYETQGLGYRAIATDKVGHLRAVGHQATALVISGYLDGKIPQPACRL